MIANGTLKTIEDDTDIYVSLTQLCDYFTQSSIQIKKESEALDGETRNYANGMVDLMFSITQEMLEFGKFEAQRRMIEGPEDLLRMIDKNPFGIVE
jgi:hypothetical protein